MVLEGIPDPDCGDGTYSNPVLPMDFSDPDVVRWKDGWLLVSSSFGSSPGLPLLHSLDLVHWELVNYLVPRLGWQGHERPAHGKGVWAPSLRVREGRVYAYFGSPDEGIFMTSTTDPFGPWDELCCVKRAIGWIDPCPFWDDDGTAWLVNAFANSRVGFKSVLRLNRMSADGREVLPEGRFIFDGQYRHLTMEGPKLYKKNGWYYIFAPAGGVVNGWQTVLRSRELWGPWEDRIVLHQGGTAVNGPHQGGWIEDSAGDSWFLHFQDRGAFGRIVHLQPMTWNFDWPFIGIDQNNDGVGEPLLRFRTPSPLVPRTQTFPLAVKDSGVPPHLGPLPSLLWQWQGDQPDPRTADPAVAWCIPGVNRGSFTLRAQPWPVPGSPNLLDLPSVLTRMVPAGPFSFACAVGPGFLLPGTLAGLVLLGMDYHALALEASGDNETDSLSLVLLKGGQRWDGRADAIAESRYHARTLLASFPLRAGHGPAGADVRVGLDCDASGLSKLWFELPGQARVVLAGTFPLSNGLWVGARLGLFAVGPHPCPVAFSGVELAHAAGAEGIR